MEKRQIRGLAIPCVLLMLSLMPAKAEAETIGLRANLLRWATLTPDAGVEWHVNPSWSIQVNGTWTSWRWDDRNRRYALWEVSREVRYYVGSNRCGYVGAMFHVGSFNYKLSGTGKQGDLVGGGLTGGTVVSRPADGHAIKILKN